MFLDDKLKELYDTYAINFTGEAKEVCYDYTKKLILRACAAELPDPKNPEAFLLELKRVNNSFKLFQRKHDSQHIFEPNSFEMFVWDRVKDDEESALRIFKRLGWKNPLNKRKSLF